MNRLKSKELKALMNFYSPSTVEEYLLLQSINMKILLLVSSYIEMFSDFRVPEETDEELKRIGSNFLDDLRYLGIHGLKTFTKDTISDYLTKHSSEISFATYVLAKTSTRKQKKRKI